MAIKRTNGGFVGLSTDTKPSERVRPLSVFNEVDSGKIFHWLTKGGTAGWYLDTIASSPTGPTGPAYYS